MAENGWENTCYVLDASQPDSGELFLFQGRRRIKDSTVGLKASQFASGETESWLVHAPAHTPGVAAPRVKSSQPHSSSRGSTVLLRGQCGAGSCPG